jgi:hypothetical protein
MNNMDNKENILEDEDNDDDNKFEDINLSIIHDLCKASEASIHTLLYIKTHKLFISRKDIVLIRGYLTLLINPLVQLYIKKHFQIKLSDETVKEARILRIELVILSFAHVFSRKKKEYIGRLLHYIIDIHKIIINQRNILHQCNSFYI